MRHGIKYVSTAVITAAVLAAAACGGSGKGASNASSVAGGHSGATLTTDQAISLLLTDTGQPGYVYDAAEDAKFTNYHPAVVTAGGSPCQTFLDAEAALSAKYDTAVDVIRDFTKPVGSGDIQDQIIVLPSEDKASAMFSDLTTGLKGCPSFSQPQNDSTFSVTVSAIPQITGAGHVGYTETSTSHDSYTKTDITTVIGTEVVQVGAVVVEIIFDEGPHEVGSPQQISGTLSHLADLQSARVKTAEGSG